MTRMDRQSTLLQLAQKLNSAAANSDWKALAAIDTLVANTLPALAARGRWTPAERAALNALRSQHSAALASVAGKSAELDRHLQDTRKNREGWIAYTLDNDNAVIGTDA